jgi:hypothetical protein
MNGKDLGPVSHWISSMNFGPLDAIIGNDVWLFHTLSCIHFFFFLIMCIHFFLIETIVCIHYLSFKISPKFLF